MPSTRSTQAPPIGDCAIIVSSEDNLAVVRKLTAPGFEVALPGGRVLRVNDAVFERMSRDIDLSAGGVLDGTETIEEVGARVFEHVVRVAGGEVPARAEEHKHREFQFWAEQTVSL
jgi:hypothetical protein